MREKNHKASKSAVKRPAAASSPLFISIGNNRQNGLFLFFEKAVALQVITVCPSHSENSTEAQSSELSGFGADLFFPTERTGGKYFQAHIYTGTPQKEIHQRLIALFIKGFMLLSTSRVDGFP